MAIVTLAIAAGSPAAGRPIDSGLTGTGYPCPGIFPVFNLAELYVGATDPGSIEILKVYAGPDYLAVLERRSYTSPAIGSRLRYLESNTKLRVLGGEYVQPLETVNPINAAYEGKSNIVTGGLAKELSQTTYLLDRVIVDEVVTSNPLNYYSVTNNLVHMFDKSVLTKHGHVFTGFIANPTPVQESFTNSSGTIFDCGFILNRGPIAFNVGATTADIYRGTNPTDLRAANTVSVNSNDLLQGSNISNDSVWCGEDFLPITDEEFSSYGVRTGVELPINSLLLGALSSTGSAWPRMGRKLSCFDSTFYTCVPGTTSRTRSNLRTSVFGLGKVTQSIDTACIAILPAREITPKSISLFLGDLTKNITTSAPNSSYSYLALDHKGIVFGAALSHDTLDQVTGDTIPKLGMSDFYKYATTVPYGAQLAAANKPPIGYMQDAFNFTTVRDFGYQINHLLWSTAYPLSSPQPGTMAYEDELTALENPTNASLAYRFAQYDEVKATQYGHVLLDSRSKELKFMTYQHYSQLLPSALHLPNKLMHAPPRSVDWKSAWNMGLGVDPTNASTASLYAAQPTNFETDNHIHGGGGHLSAVGTYNGIEVHDGVVSVWGSNRWGQCIVPDFLNFTTLGGILDVAASVAPILLNNGGFALNEEKAEDSARRYLSLGDPGYLSSLGANLSLYADASYPYSGGPPLAPPSLQISTKRYAAHMFYYNVPAHVCVVLGNGRVFCWGNNDNHQCDVPDAIAAWDLVNKVARATITGGGAVVEVAAGAYHNVARTADGTIYTWGAGAPTTTYSNIVSNGAVTDTEGYLTKATYPLSHVVYAPNTYSYDPCPIGCVNYPACLPTAEPCPDTNDYRIARSVHFGQACLTGKLFAPTNSINGLQESSDSYSTNGSYLSSNITTVTSTVAVGSTISVGQKTAAGFSVANPTGKRLKGIISAGAFHTAIIDAQLKIQCIGAGRGLLSTSASFTDRSRIYRNRFEDAPGSGLTDHPELVSQEAKSMWGTSYLHTTYPHYCQSISQYAAPLEPIDVTNVAGPFSVNLFRDFDADTPENNARIFQDLTFKKVTCGPFTTHAIIHSASRASIYTAADKVKLNGLVVGWGRAVPTDLHENLVSDTGPTGVYLGEASLLAINPSDPLEYNLTKYNPCANVLGTGRHKKLSTATNCSLVMRDCVLVGCNGPSKDPMENQLLTSGEGTPRGFSLINRSRHLNDSAAFKFLTTDAEDALDNVVNSISRFSYPTMAPITISKFKVKDVSPGSDFTGYVGYLNSFQKSYYLYRPGLQTETNYDPGLGYTSNIYACSTFDFEASVFFVGAEKILFPEYLNPYSGFKFIKRNKLGKAETVPLDGVPEDQVDSFEGSNALKVKTRSYYFGKILQATGETLTISGSTKDVKSITPSTIQVSSSGTIVVINSDNRPVAWKAMVPPSNQEPSAYSLDVDFGNSLDLSLLPTLPFRDFKTGKGHIVGVTDGDWPIAKSLKDSSSGPTSSGSLGSLIGTLAGTNNLVLQGTLKSHQPVLIAWGAGDGREYGSSILHGGFNVIKSTADSTTCLTTASCGTCDEVHPTPNCSNSDCSTCVCTYTAFGNYPYAYCCEPGNEWDQTCVAAARLLCTYSCTGADNCCPGTNVCDLLPNTDPGWNCLTSIRDYLTYSFGGNNYTPYSYCANAAGTAAGTGWNANCAAVSCNFAYLGGACSPCDKGCSDFIDHCCPGANECGTSAVECRAAVCATPGYANCCRPDLVGGGWTAACAAKACTLPLFPGCASCFGSGKCGTPGGNCCPGSSGCDYQPHGACLAAVCAVIPACGLPGQWNANCAAVACALSTTPGHPCAHCNNQPTCNPKPSGSCCPNEVGQGCPASAGSGCRATVAAFNFPIYSFCGTGTATSWTLACANLACLYEFSASCSQCSIDGLPNPATACNFDLNVTGFVADCCPDRPDGSGGILHNIECNNVDRPACRAAVCAYAPAYATCCTAGGWEDACSELACSLAACSHCSSDKGGPCPAPSNCGNCLTAHSGPGCSGCLPGYTCAGTTPIWTATSCCYPHSTTGCSNAACRAEVCNNYDPSCCSGPWTANCATAAASACPDICSAASDCDAPYSPSGISYPCVIVNESTGYSTGARPASTCCCETAVCSYYDFFKGTYPYAYCCTAGNNWDAACAAIANQVCICSTNPGGGVGLVDPTTTTIDRFSLTRFPEVDSRSPIALPGLSAPVCDMDPGAPWGDKVAGTKAAPYGMSFVDTRAMTRYDSTLTNSATGYATPVSGTGTDLPSFTALGYKQYKKLTTAGPTSDGPDSKALNYYGEYRWIVHSDETPVDVITTQETKLTNQYSDFQTFNKLSLTALTSSSHMIEAMQSLLFFDSNRYKTSTAINLTDNSLISGTEFAKVPAAFGMPWINTETTMADKFKLCCTTAADASTVSSLNHLQEYHGSLSLLKQNNYDYVIDYSAGAMTTGILFSSSVSDFSQVALGGHKTTLSNYQTYFETPAAGFRFAKRRIRKLALVGYGCEGQTAGTARILADGNIVSVVPRIFAADAKVYCGASYTAVTNPVRVYSVNTNLASLPLAGQTLTLVTGTIPSVNFSNRIRGLDVKITFSNSTAGQAPTVLDLGDFKITIPYKNTKWEVLGNIKKSSSVAATINMPLNLHSQVAGSSSSLIISDRFNPNLAHTFTSGVEAYSEAGLTPVALGGTAADQSAYYNNTAALWPLLPDAVTETTTNKKTGCLPPCSTVAGVSSLNTWSYYDYPVTGTVPLKFDESTISVTIQNTGSTVYTNIGAITVELTFELDDGPYPMVIYGGTKAGIWTGYGSNGPSYQADYYNFNINDPATNKPLEQSCPCLLDATLDDNLTLAGRRRRVSFGKDSSFICGTKKYGPSGNPELMANAITANLGYITSSANKKIHGPTTTNFNAVFSRIVNRPVIADLNSLDRSDPNLFVFAPINYISTPVNLPVSPSEFQNMGLVVNRAEIFTTNASVLLEPALIPGIASITPVLIVNDVNSKNLILRLPKGDLGRVSVQIQSLAEAKELSLITVIDLTCND